MPSLTMDDLGLFSSDAAGSVVVAPAQPQVGVSGSPCRNATIELASAAPPLPSHAPPAADTTVALERRQWQRRQAIIVSRAGNRTASFLVAKRALDLAGASLALLILSPLLATTWVVLMITTRGKPLYVGPREGVCGKRFSMYKFRTMVVDADKKLHLVANEQHGAMFKNRQDPRITRFGRLLRAFSIDELPQLFNVLLGHMSLVGPRPMVPAKDNVYLPWQLARLAVKPGITGLWQVSGRSEIGFEDMVRLDIRYSRQQSIWLDLKILFRTPLVVFSGKGAY